MVETQSLSCLSIWNDQSSEANGSGSSPSSTEHLATPPSGCLPLHPLGPPYPTTARPTVEDPCIRALWSTTPTSASALASSPGSYYPPLLAPIAQRDNTSALINFSESAPCPSSVSCKEEAIARLFAPPPGCDSSLTAGARGRRASVQDDYFSPASSSSGVGGLRASPAAEQLDPRALATRQALERVFSSDGLPIANGRDVDSGQKAQSLVMPDGEQQQQRRQPKANTPPVGSTIGTVQSSSAAMASLAAAAGQTTRSDSQQLAQKLRQRSQSSAAILSPPQSPPRPNGSQLAAAAPPFEPSSLPTGCSIWSGAAAPGSPSASTGGGSPLVERYTRTLAGSFQAHYNWDPILQSGVQADEREGRSPSRIHIPGAASGGDWMGTGSSQARDVSTGSYGSLSSSVHSGIGMSNMSPFTGTSMLPPVGMQGIGFAGFGGRNREGSLGAVGTGRGSSVGGIGFHTRSGGRDGWMSGGRSLTNDLDEDEEFAQPTRSGATSRRHSVAAFTGRSQIGFDIPGMSKAPSSQGSARPTNGGGITMFGSGSSALTDDDLLASDLNSLHLNLEAHKREQDRKHHQQHQRQSSPTMLRSPSSLHPSLPQPPHFQPQRPANQHQFTQQERPQRTPSFSAGDPFSASAQASRYFAQQVQQSTNSAGPPPPPPQQQGNGVPRFPFGAAAGPLAGGRPAPAQLNLASATTGAFFPGAGPAPPATPMSAGLPGPPFSAGPLSPFSGGSAQLGLSSMGMPMHPQAIPPHLATSNSLGIANPRLQPGLDLSELGKGVPLHQVPLSCPLYIVEFKGGRTDLFYLPDPSMAPTIQKGDMVIVEADRGKDLGKVVHDQITIEEVQAFQQHQVEMALASLSGAAVAAAQQPQQQQQQPQQPQGSMQGDGNGAAPGSSGAKEGGQPAPPNPATISRMTKEIHPKKIYGKATPADAQMLLLKAQDEAKALALCRAKAMQRGLQMEITAAEWQWDRRKLTFFFVADKRVDFRELVRDLYRIWKTRIWMCSIG